jgi:uncharacterized protein (DUF2147 family)
VHAAGLRPPTGLWFTEDKGGVIQISACGKALCGYIVGLSDWPANGDVLRDHAGNPQCHLPLLRNLRLQDDGKWHGTVTNPEDGTTYNALVWVPQDGVLRLRGYLLVPVIGATQLWPPFKGKVQNDCHFG